MFQRGVNPERRRFSKWIVIIAGVFATSAHLIKSEAPAATDGQVPTPFQVAQTVQKPTHQKFNPDKEFVWNSVMDEFSENCSMIETDERGPDGKRVPYFLALKRKDGVFVVASPDDKGSQEWKEKVGKSIILDRKGFEKRKGESEEEAEKRYQAAYLERWALFKSRFGFASEKEAQASYSKLWDIFIKKLLEKSKAQYSQVIAKQRTIITPRKAGEWIVPGVISLYCESDGTTRLSLVDEKGFLKPLGISALDHEYLARYSVMRSMMVQFNARPQPVIIVMKQFPVFTVMELGKDGIFRDITKSKYIQDLTKSIIEEQKEVCEICKSRTYVRTNPNDRTIYIKTPDNKLTPLIDPSSDPEWMRLTEKARESYKAISGDLIKLIKSEVPWPTTEISVPTKQTPP